jgi:hypothetical protein
LFESQLLRLSKELEDKLSPENQELLNFNYLLEEKIYLSQIKSSNSKEELEQYIPLKDTFIALHDKFLRYGTRRATSFLIIDVDNNNTPFETYYKDIVLKLGIAPNWLLKTNKGFHLGFILKTPLWLNNIVAVQKAQAIKKYLTQLLNADISGSHRLIGYWRNPLVHKSKFDLKLHSLEELEALFLKRPIETEFPKLINNFSMKTKSKVLNPKEFHLGNRNNYLFSTVIGMLYNGIIKSDEVLRTLVNINNNELDIKEVQKIAKSILKYNITPLKNKNEAKEERGIYYNDLWKHKIHNYYKKNKMQYERQKLAQGLTTAKIIKSTISKLVKGYLEIYNNAKGFNNKTIEQYSKVSKRTIQRYRNERGIEEAIKVRAFKLFIKNITLGGVNADVTPINELINIVLDSIEYYYSRTKKMFKFRIDEDGKVTFYQFSKVLL